MKRFINRLSWANRIMLLSLLLLLVTNPWSVGYIDFAMEWLGGKLVEYSSIGNAVASGGIVLTVVINMYNSREVTNVPKKSAKTTRAGKYIDTER